ncbi:SGNH/GDSL hydrolase family protein [uncultured Psychroserpens sp.]|uniref:SGNH/GDSL hydrolase family protein n=1 Tax=uncultured Psychroserpens sp. TaxID=255436 RepID=UPI002637BBDB|nr:SGNH/GDSL hydrolase family protein [uncultured Psychroserpens sp.]
MQLRFIWILFISLSFYSQDKSKQLLFVGNSLTYTNDLPKIVEHIASNFNETVETIALCYPNYALVDHLKEGKLQKLLKTGTFDYVIVQQGPSSQNEGKQMLLNDGAKIKVLCDDNGSQLAFFMVWPSKYYYHTFDAVIANHKLAAKTNNALLCPVGELWKAYDTVKGLETLYSTDDFHPSKAGSFLAALTIFNTIYPDKTLKDLPFEMSQTWMTSKDSFHSIIKLINNKNLKK